MNTTNPIGTNRGMRVIPFLCALFCFILPFVEVSCSGKVEQLSGFQCITRVETLMNRKAAPETQSREIAVHLAFAMSFMGVLVATIAAALGNVHAKLVASTVGGASLIGLLISKSATESFVRDEGQGIAFCSWQFGFYAAVMLLLIGSLASAFQAFSNPTKAQATAVTI